MPSFYSDRYLLGPGEYRGVECAAPIDATVVRIFVDPPNMGLHRVGVGLRNVLAGTGYISGETVKELSFGLYVRVGEKILMTLVNPTLSPCGISVVFEY